MTFIKARAADFDHHLGKPVSPADLITAVASLCGRSRP
jgi:CheY-like chemotaxis protein